MFGGNLSILPMLFLASGTVPLSTSCAIAVGVYSSFCGVTSTVTVTSSVLLSG